MMHKKTLDVVSQFSRTIFILILLLAIVSAITNIKVLLWLAAFLACISGITPGVMILFFKAPWLAQSWLRGINTIAMPSEPWEKLRNWQKFLIYFVSMVLFVSVIFAIASYINQWFLNNSK